MLLLATTMLLATAMDPSPVTREEAAAAVLHSLPAHAPLAPAEHVATRAASTTTLTHTVFGYYPDYVGDDFSSFRFDLLSHVGYFTGGCTATGGFAKGAWPYDGLVQAAHAQGTKVMLVVPCFSEARIHQILTEPAKRQAFIDGVVAAMSEGEPADGVDLDFETMAGHHLGEYPDFVADLVAAVRQVLPNAEFSSALPAVDWGQAYDYPALAAILDHLIIMGYDYHYKGGNPGPVSPLDYTGAPWTGYSYDLMWSINDYRSAINDPALDGKILLGVPYYGYDWPSTSFDVPGTKTANATSRFFRDSYVMTAGVGALDPASQSKFYFYEDAGVKHQLWYDDAETLGLKYGAVKETGLGGIAIWALTYDGDRPELWDALETSFAVPAEPEPTPDGPRGAIIWQGDDQADPTSRGCAVARTGTASLNAVFVFVSVCVIVFVFDRFQTAANIGFRGKRKRKR